jgi:hypothetical protein
MNEEERKTFMDVEKEVEKKDKDEAEKLFKEM